MRLRCGGELLVCEANTPNCFHIRALLLVALLTFGADLADLLHVVLGAVVDGVRDSALGDGFVLAGRRRAKHGDVLHRLAQLSGGDANATCRPERCAKC